MLLDTRVITWCERGYWYSIRLEILRGRSYFVHEQESSWKTNFPGCLWSRYSGGLYPMILQLMQNPAQPTGGCGVVTTGEPQVGDRCCILFQDRSDFANCLQATTRQSLYLESYGKIDLQICCCCLPCELPS